MGVQRLQIKTALRYRPSTIQAAYYCGICRFFLLDKKFKGNVLCDKGAEHRCVQIGNQPGRLYRINYHYKCDKFEYRER